MGLSRPRPVSDLSDRLAAPVGLLIAFGLLLALLLAAYSLDLDRALARLPEARNDLAAATPVRAALRTFADTRPGQPTLEVTMAKALVGRLAGDGRGPESAVRRCLYRNLLLIGDRRQRLPGLFLAVADFGLPGTRPGPGFAEAARSGFGLDADSLSLGESLLLVHQALAPGAAGDHDRPALIGIRNRLLHQALQRGVIDGSTYQTEADRPLSWAVDPTPIW